uniref:CHK domain-containing protein n=1 Tax=Rhabditophanes sp. KR3021 TaxID=114890 RepID=A0AC35UDX3_9BILA
MVRPTTFESYSYEIGDVLGYIGKYWGMEEAYDVKNLEGFTSELLTSGDAFFSEVLNVNFKWKEGFEKNIESVVMKIPVLTVVDSQKNQDICKTEDAYINQLLSDFSFNEMVLYQFASKHPELKIPKYYYGHMYDRSHNKGILIIESFKNIGKTVDIFSGLNKSQINNTIIEIAKLHALSIVDRSWSENIITFDNSETYTEVAVKTMDFLLKKSPEQFKQYENKIRPYLTRESFQQTMYLGDNFGFPSVLVAGDLWAPNIIFKTDFSGNVTDEVSAIIDFQLLKSGNPCEDIIRLVGVNSEILNNREGVNDVLQLYITTFNEHIPNKSKIDMKTLLKLYKHALPGHLIYYLFGVQFYYQMAGNAISNSNANARGQGFDQGFGRPQFDAGFDGSRFHVDPRFHGGRFADPRFGFNGPAFYPQWRPNFRPNWRKFYDNGEINQRSLMTLDLSADAKSTETIMAIVADVIPRVLKLIGKLAPKDEEEKLRVFTESIAQRYFAGNWELHLTQPQLEAITKELFYITDKIVKAPIKASIQVVA